MSLLFSPIPYPPNGFSTEFWSFFIQLQYSFIWKILKFPKKQVRIVFYHKPAVIHKYTHNWSILSASHTIWLSWCIRPEFHKWCLVNNHWASSAPSPSARAVLARLRANARRRRSAFSPSNVEERSSRHSMISYVSFDVKTGSSDSRRGSVSKRRVSQKLEKITNVVKELCNFLQNPSVNAVLKLW